ncbi:MAG: DUF1028 domain-containing protein [Pseudomonadota bacterium]
MTYSILAFDRKTGVLGAAAATGSLCVGGWVLRGSLDSGLVASQGTAPSSFWRDGVLRAMQTGTAASDAVRDATEADAGRNHRQLTALDPSGTTAGFTGASSVPFAAHACRSDLAVAGNMLGSRDVLDALAEAFVATEGDMQDRLICALRAAADAGSDRRGLISAAMLVLSPDAAALDLRIDYAEEPLDALSSLLTRTRDQPYAGWLDVVPVEKDPTRAPIDQSPKAAE